MSYGLHCNYTHLDWLTMSWEDGLRMMCQQTRFLTRKLRKDLEDGDKIFVYRYLGPVPDEEGMLALARAVSGHGQNTLLFVCKADEHHPPFSVRLIYLRLTVGHIDWFAPERLQFPANLDGWTRLCEGPHRICQGQRPS